MPTTFPKPVYLVTTLRTAHANGDGMLVLQTGDGVKLGALGANQVYAISAVVAPGLTEADVCDFRATGLTGDTLTGVTSDGRLPDTSVAAGTAMQVRITASWMGAINAAVNTIETTIVTQSAVLGGKLDIAANLSDLASVTVARSNLGLVIGTNVLAPNGSAASLTALNASALASGTVPTARLGSGTADTTTYLRGDGTWQAVGGGSTGTVTSVAMTVPAGLTVAGSPITGAGTFAISTTLSGVLKGTGSGFAAAVAGTDYLTPTGNGSGLTNLTAGNLSSGTVATARLGSGSASSTTFLRGDNTWATPSGGGSGTVTSVGLTMPGGFAVGSSPVTGSGTIAVTTALSGMVKASGGAFSAAVADTDYIAPFGNGSTLTGITQAQVSGLVSALAAKATDTAVVHVTGNETIAGTKTFSATITGSVSGNAGTVTNGVVTTGSYADPAWITGLDGSKISGTLPPIAIPRHTAAMATATDGATVTFACGTNNRHQVTLGGNRTLALSGDSDGQAITLRLVQDGTGSRTVAWFSGITWAGGSAPTLATAAGAWDTVVIQRISSGVYDGFLAGSSAAASSAIVERWGFGNSGTLTTGAKPILSLVPYACTGLKLTATGTGTFTALVEVSTDDGGTWSTLATISLSSGHSHSQASSVSIAAGSLLRPNYTAASASDVAVALYTTR